MTTKLDQPLENTTFDEQESHPTQQKKSKFHKTCWVKTMDYLARRDHSEKELIQKLSKHYEMDEIEQTLEEVKKRGWLLPEDELSEKVTEQLHRKNKGHLYILHFLRKKGLPEVPKDIDREIDKARALMTSKRIDSTDIKRLTSLLKNRGFDTETIGRVIHEVRRSSPSIY